MKKFQQNMNRELKRPFPDRHKLESQCISAISFGASTVDGKNNGNVLNLPIWIMAINVVAMEMLRTKLPPLPCKLFNIHRVFPICKMIPKYLHMI